MKTRSFIAINLPPETKKKLAVFLEKFKKANRDKPIKWVRIEGIHLTLHFLGYLDEKQIEQVELLIEDKIKQLQVYSFELEIGGIDGFPNLNRPRVVFVECRQNEGQSLINLQKAIGQGLEKIGIEVDSRPWRAHITLARFKIPAPLRLVSQNELIDQKFWVKSVDLMKSELRLDGARYSIIKSFPLLG